MNKNKAFTLVELLVVVAIVGLLSGGTVVYINKSKSREKIAAAKNELSANLRMARNYARGLQTPAGYAGSLTSVGVRIATNGTMTVYPLPGGTPNYFVRNVATGGVTVTTSSDIILFSAYEGKVSRLDDGGLPVPVPLDVGETISIIIASGEDVDDTKTLIVNNVGLIDEVILTIGDGGGSEQN
jgi:prepilin-type N-terminal cleavage/methylation domain-containing protein